MLFLLPILITQCVNNAPRDNPLDPINHSSEPRFKITGNVLSFYQPFQPIPGAMLWLKPTEQVVIADNAGQFQFDNLLPGNYVLSCTATQFRGDSISLNLKSDTTLAFHLDALPFFKKISLTTHHLSRFFPPDDLYWLKIEVQVDDNDGVNDVQWVYYRIEQQNYQDTLMQTSTPGVLGIQRNANDFPSRSIHSLMGHAFLFTAEDQPGARVQALPQFISRIIETTPELIEPTSLNIISGFPITFRWQPVFLPFPFSFKIEIYRVDFGIPSLIFDQSAIPSTSTELLFNTQLTAGDYFWVLYIIDEFGNSSRSREGAFRVQ